MNALSPVIVEKFCDLCNSAYEGWGAFCALFPTGLTQSDIRTPAAGNGLVQINIASQEYFIHKICKLHDRAVQNDRVNLGIDYIVRFGTWDDDVKRELLKLQAQLETFANKLRGARNKILSHNDLETILEEAPLGAFPAGEDVEYFKILQNFVNVVHGTVIGGDFRFNPDASVEAAELLLLLKR